MAKEQQLIAAQIEYYCARAAEYDEWFYRTGRYDRGEVHRQQWNSEVEIVSNALRAAKPKGRVLELACGTGLWTEHLITNAESLLAVDASPEMLEITRQRVPDMRLELRESDIFAWNSEQCFDFIFFGFWLSHVPEVLFVHFWEKVKAALAPDGRVFFVDSLLTQESTARDHSELERTGRAQRKLNDGREFEIVKVFYEPLALQQRLHGLGWSGEVRTTAEFFLYANLHR